MYRHTAGRVIALSCAGLAALNGCGGGSGTGFAAPPTQAATADGSGPSGLIQSVDGNFYGTTSAGGKFNLGTVFTITAAGTETVLYSFGAAAADGADPSAGLVQGSDGNFYGTTTAGGTGTCAAHAPVAAGCGTVFRVTAAGAETVLYSFTGATDGNAPGGPLIQGSDGNFYGTAASGGLTNATCGPGGCGVVFAITPEGAESVRYSFGAAADAGDMPTSLVRGSNGDFYGTTFLGGQSNKGTVFIVTPAGAETVLYSFSGGQDGYWPQAPLIQGSNGDFYGTTNFGGISTDNPVTPCINNGCGTVFSITPAGAEAVLYAFGGNSADGAYPAPAGALIQSAAGTFYGTTSQGGLTGNCSGGCGTVFSITPGGAQTTLYLFAGGATDGASPQTGLVQGTDGNFYGTTAVGGQFNTGTVVKVTAAGAEEVLHSFGANASN
jgi:uncharacterized repeat protein (TIGR03803 family)